MTSTALTGRATAGSVRRGRFARRLALGFTATAVVLGIGAAGTGVAFAATPAAVPAIAQMDEMMAQMVQDLPVDQQTDATAMHEQMRPAMQKVMSGEMGAPMDEHHGEMPGG